MRENKVLIYLVINQILNINFNTMRNLLYTTNKAETIFNIVSFAIGCTLVATCIFSLIYGILTGLL